MVAEALGDRLTAEGVVVGEAMLKIQMWQLFPEVNIKLLLATEVRLAQQEQVEVPEKILLLVVVW